MGLRTRFGVGSSGARRSDHPGDNFYGAMGGKARRGHLDSIMCVGWGEGWLERAGHVSSSSNRWRQQLQKVGGTILAGWWPELDEERLGRELGQ